MAYPMAKEGSIDSLLGKLDLVAPTHSDRANTHCKRLAEERTQQEGYTLGSKDYALRYMGHYSNNLRLAITLYSNGQ